MTQQTITGVMLRTLMLALALVAVAFYWFSVRPAGAKIACAQQQEQAQGGNPFVPKGTDYEMCLHSKGI